MKIIKKEMEVLAKKLGDKVIEKILAGDFRLKEYGSCDAEIFVDDEYFSIWITNSIESLDFYEGSVIYDNALTHLLKKFYSIPDNKKPLIKETLFNKQLRKEAEEGLRRKIEQTQLSNDLFFKFKGVYSDVKFTGYNDNDWWTKYKPSEIKEAENITWTIDWKKMEAVYKPKE
jgi:hypothetical protein